MLRLWRPWSSASSACANLTIGSKASDLIRPIVAAEDVTADKTGSRRQIAYTVFDSFALQLDLSFAAAGLWPGRAVPGLADRRVADRCSATASGPGAKMNRLLTAFWLLVDLSLTKGRSEMSADLDAARLITYRLAERHARADGGDHCRPLPRKIEGRRDRKPDYPHGADARRRAWDL